MDWIHYSPILGIEVAFELAVMNRYGTTEDERNAFRMVAKGKYIANIKISADSFEIPGENTKEGK